MRDHVWPPIEQLAEIGCIDLEILAAADRFGAGRIAAPVRVREREARGERLEAGPCGDRTRAAVDEQDFGSVSFAGDRDRAHGVAVTTRSSQPPNNSRASGGAAAARRPPRTPISGGWPR